MKRAFLMFAIVAPFVCFASKDVLNSDAALKEAACELSSLKAEFAQTAKARSEEKDALLKKLEDLRSEKKKLFEELKNLENEGAELVGMEVQLKHYSQISSEIFSNAFAFRKSFLSRADGVKFQMSVADSSNFAKDVLKESFARVFDSTKPFDGKLELASGETLDGKFFRIGQSKYFCANDASRAGFVSKNGRLYGESHSKEILAFKNGKTKKIPADLSGGALERSEIGKMGIADQVSLGGVWMYPILFFGAFSAIVFVCKFFEYFRIRRVDIEILKPVFAKLSANDEKSALEISSSISCPYSDLLSGLISSRKLGVSTLEEISYEYMLSSGEKLFYGLGVLSVTAAVAPLFGLLGTVTGIIKTFADLSARVEGVNTGVVSSGISEALITTEYGLVVAIPAFVAHALLSRRARAVMSDMEKISSAFMAKIQTEK